MRQRSALSRLFRRPPHVTSVTQWLGWRTRRQWQKLRRRSRELKYSLTRTARSTVIPDMQLSVHTNSRDPVSLEFVREGVWEPVETEIMLRVIEPGMTVVDVGANLGYHAVLASRLVGPTGRVLAFEPAPGNFRLLEKNLARNRCANVQAHQKAVGAEGGQQATLFLAADNLGDHRVFRDPDEQGRQEISIATVAADDVIGSTPVHFIKMDIQGAEDHALRGMSRTLDRNENLVVLLEFWPYGLRRAASEPEDVLARLVEAGLALRIAPASLDEVNENGPLTAPASPEEILTRVRGERFEDALNVIAARGAGAALL